ncbi:MAG TPA: hypothetical protein VGL83_00815 [Stellaceae bacterium]|jgi:hypothetical protein
MSRTDDRMGRRAKPRDDDAMRAEPGFRADPRLGRTAKQTGPVVEDADRPLHLSHDVSRGGPNAFGWLVLGVVAALAAGGYAWYTHTPATPQPVASGYSTPMQPPGQDDAQTLGSAGQVTNPGAASQPTSSTTATGTTAPGQDLNSVAVTATPAPHMVPSVPVPKAPTPLASFKPPATTPAKPSADHANPPPQKHEAQEIAPPKHDTAPAATPPKPAPKKDAALDLPKPQPQVPAPQPAAADAPGPVAPVPTAADNAAPPLGANSVTVNGLTYIDGQQPHALGSLNTTVPAPAASHAPTSLTPTPAAAPAAQTTPYTPSDSAAPLPNDVIVAPNGQMSVPTGH